MIHVINFFIFMAMSVFEHYKQAEFVASTTKYFIIAIVFDLFSMYVTIFIIYLIIQFTKKI